MTDWRLDAILRMDKETGMGEEIVASVEEGSRLYGIKVFSIENQRIDSKLSLPNFPDTLIITTK